MVRIPPGYWDFTSHGMVPATHQRYWWSYLSWKAFPVLIQIHHQYIFSSCSFQYRMNQQLLNNVATIHSTILTTQKCLIPYHLKTSGWLKVIWEEGWVNDSYPWWRESGQCQDEGDQCILGGVWLCITEISQKNRNVTEATWSSHVEAL